MPADNIRNPLLTPTPFPPFDRIEASHAEPAIAQILDTAEETLARLEEQAKPTWKGLMLPLRELSRPLDYAWGLVHHYMGVLNSDDWRAAEKALQPRVVAFSLRVGQSQALFRAMEGLRDGPDWDALSPVRQRIVASSLRSMRLAGVGLPDVEREEFNTLKRELAELSTRFQNNLLDATKAFALVLHKEEEVDGLPPSARRAAAQAARATGNTDATAAAGPWRITLDAPSFIPFMMYSTRRELREALYRAYIRRAADGDLDNTELITAILRKRRRMAALLGVASYADLSIEKKMAGSVNAIDALQERLRRAARPAAETDCRELDDLRRAEGGACDELMNWDIGFWAERLRQKCFDYSDEDLRPYFQFPKVLEGLFALTRDVFGVDIVSADGEVPVWHEDVRFFRVQDPDGTPRAAFYLDPYSRPATKRGGAWMDPAFARERREADTLLPVVYLACNQTLPDGDTPSLMTFTEVTTLFHEFGHGLQHMLTTVDDPEAAGVNNIEWDAVELASQFMENWCYHQPTLTGLTEHVETGEALPRALFKKMAAARTFRAGSNMLRQLFYGMLDMELHARLEAVGPAAVAEAKARVAVQTTVLPLLPEDRLLCGFAHIFSGGYAAGYYSYKWAEVLSADAFAAFEEAGLDDPGAIRDLGRRYRDTVLALGGGTHPMEVFHAFRGREPDPAALLRHSGLA